MSLNLTPSSDRLHIGIFGRRNAGKSSLINALTNQSTSVVSSVAGTTTDPVFKSMELLPLGPVLIIDTPGLDDEGELGNLRIEKTNQILVKTDLALVVIDLSVGETQIEKQLFESLKEKNIPYITVYNKADLFPKTALTGSKIAVSAKDKTGLDRLFNAIISKKTSNSSAFPIVADLIQAGDFVVLVAPIDESAPKGRIILPQQQTLREILDCRAVSVVCQPSELEKTLSSISNPPKLIITDSQAFKAVSEIVPQNMPLTSFSILMSRHKGELFKQLEASDTLDTLKDRDKILIAEGCTHHRQCGDIGSVKLPEAIRKYTGKNLSFSFTSGKEFPSDLTKFKMIIHCGGCMLNEREMQFRINSAEKKHIPISNYGMILAKTSGILQRCVEIFK